jgi:DnaJ-class molecular chaperone
MSENFYKILGVNENATHDEIKKAYRGLSLKFHPDKNPSPEATEKYKKINEAYDVLGDVQNKQKYDMERKNPFMRMGGMGGPGGPGVDVDEIFKAFFGGANGIPFGMRMGGMPGMHGMDAEDIANINNFGMGMGMGMGGLPPGAHFQVFHNGVPVNMGRPNKPSPIIKNVTIDIEQVYTGTTIPVEIERWIHENNLRVSETENLYVTIPKGIDDGEIIILKDKGNIINDSCKGDVKIFVKIINNTDIKRSGLDLMYEKKISLKDALCGFSFEIKYINGKMYTLNNTSGNIISPGYRKIIPNMGLSRENAIGNLIITFHIDFPEKLTDEQINQLKNVFII